MQQSHRRIVSFVLLAIFSVIGVATGKSESDNSGATPGQGPAVAQGPIKYCDTSTGPTGKCQEIEMSSPSAAHAAEMCATVRGTFGDAPCPSAQRVGRCTGLPIHETWNFYSPAFTPEIAQQTCTRMMGQWAATP